MDLEQDTSDNATCSRLDSNGPDDGEIADLDSLLMQPVVNEAFSVSGMEMETDTVATVDNAHMIWDDITGMMFVMKCLFIVIFG